MIVKDLIKALQALPPKWQEFEVRVHDQRSEHLYAPIPVNYVGIRDAVKGQWPTHIEIATLNDAG